MRSPRCCCDWPTSRSPLSQGCEPCAPTYSHRVGCRCRTAPAPPSSAPARSSRTGRVKCYGRPDKSKGLHLLPQIFDRLQSDGYSCEVALGNALQDQDTYRTKLATDLGPWLTDGPRTPAWIDPGDIFLVPSISGEAACLSAQEAMSNGAFVVASRIGLMPYLSPTNQGMRTFAINDADGAVGAVREALTMPGADFSDELRGSTSYMAQRAGRWYDETVQIIRGQQST